MKKLRLCRIFISLLILSAFLFVTGCDIKRAPYPIKKASNTDWGVILKNPKNIKATMFLTGKGLVRKSYIINLNHPGARSIKDGKITIPTMAFWIHHEKHGDFLIDAGLDKTFHADPHGHYSGIIPNLISMHGEQNKGDDMASRIAQLNINLKGIFLTHLHYDHISGLLHLPKNIELVAGKGETYINYKLLFSGDELKGIERLFEIDYSQGVDIPPLGKSVDIFGDGSLWAISTPGHTPGHTAYLVNGTESRVLIIGDASFTKSSFEKKIGPGNFCKDIKKAQKTLETLVMFSKEHPDMKIWMSHEFEEPSHDSPGQNKRY